MAERQAIAFAVEDAEALTFGDARFDVVLSTFGVMFTADHDRAAAEMLRVCRPGGTVAMANWTPDGFIGQLFRTLGRHLPPPPGARSPALWGTREAIERMFGEGATAIELTPQSFTFRYISPEDFVQFFRAFYGPVHKAFASLASDKASALEKDLIEILDRNNVAGPRSLVVPSEYVEIVVQRR